METTDSTYKSLINLFNEKEPTWSYEKKHQTVIKLIEDHGLGYYVSTIDFKLCDIANGAFVSTPAEYFNTYEAAKIYQLTNIINKHNDKTTEPGYLYNIKNSDIENFTQQLEKLSEQFPEYVL